MLNIITLSWRILDPIARKKLPLAIFLSFSIAALETLGIGLLLPLFENLISGRNLLDLKFLLEGLNIESANINQNAILGTLILVIFILKNVLGFLIVYWNINYALGIKYRLSTRLFQRYISAPYCWHITINSADIIRNLNAVYTVASSVFLPIIHSLVDIIIIISLGSFLLWTSPMLTLLSFLILTGAIFLYQYFSKNKILHASTEIMVRHRATIKNIQEALAGIREIQIYGRSDYLANIFKNHSYNHVKAQGTVSALQLLPKYYLESFFVIIVFLVVAVAFSNFDQKEILPILAIFGVIAVRLMPSLSKILSAYYQIQSGLPALAEVERDLRELATIKLTEPTPASPPDFTPCQNSDGIKVENVSFTYPNGSRTAIKNICFHIQWGEMVGIVGKTGSGKSTLVDLLSGLLDPSEGTISINNTPINSHEQKWQSKMGYVPQHIFLLDDTITRNIAFGIPDVDIDTKRVLEVLNMVSLDGLINELEEGIETSVGERGIRFSGGQRQRLGIARALYTNPQILILDEATSALDNETEAQIRDLINSFRKDRIIIVIAHRLSSVRDSDRLICMKNGEIESIAPFDELALENREFFKMLELAELN